MKKFYRVLLKILTILCVIIIAWFFIYFLRGEEFSLTFTDRVFASYFPQILVFSTGVAIYLIFILQIKSKSKWWKNLLILVFGFLFSSIPFLLYHGYFQYQCGFWKKEITQAKNLYLNKANRSEEIRIIESVCNENTQTDTVFTQQVMPYFELVNPVKIQESKNSDWVPATE